MATLHKTTRFEARMSVEQRELLERASVLTGRTMSDFIVSAAEEQARNVIEEHEVMRLTKVEREQLFDALLNPPGPNEALRRAAKRYRAQ